MLLTEVEKLYPLVYERILAQTKHSIEILKATRSTVNTVFPWNQTSEGAIFWAAIQNGRIREAKDMLPHLFEAPIKGVKISKNGLLKTEF